MYNGYSFDRILERPIRLVGHLHVSYHLRKSACGHLTLGGVHFCVDTILGRMNFPQFEHLRLLSVLTSG